MATKLITIISAFSLSMFSSIALAQGSGAGGAFSIHNDTIDGTVVGFYTNDGSGWSDNWLSEDLGPNAKIDVEFTAQTGSCAQTLQVGWLAEDDTELLADPVSIDICEATTVYLEDDGISFD